MVGHCSILSRVGASTIPGAVHLATTFGRWRGEILNYFDGRLTNGPTEGRN
jgi:transposase